MRLSKQIGSRELCRALGKHERYIYGVESGQTRVDIIEFSDIVRALGLNPVEAYRQMFDAIQRK